MERFFKLLWPLRGLMWAVIVAFMAGVQIFYRKEMDSPYSIISFNQLEEEGPAPKV